MKKLISITLALTLALIFAASAFAAPANLISEEEAKSIALEHAGLSADDVFFTKSKLDYDDGRYEYEIEFNQGYEKEYDYTIDAQSGRIVDFDYDYEYRPGYEIIGANRNFSVRAIIEAIRSFLANLFR